mmetsp:Transcript_36701/g.117910  ORF Transcript_36701/g.117910 Transcript_36701/m.117910 type:complete len:226 (+) Transcript_36701:875-1552(+)
MAARCRPFFFRPPAAPASPCRLTSTRGGCSSRFPSFCRWPCGSWRAASALCCSTRRCSFGRTSSPSTTTRTEARTPTSSSRRSARSRPLSAPPTAGSWLRGPPATKAPSGGTARPGGATPWPCCRPSSSSSLGRSTLGRRWPRPPPSAKLASAPIGSSDPFSGSCTCASTESRRWPSTETRSWYGPTDLARRRRRVSHRTCFRTALPSTANTLSRPSSGRTKSRG